MINLDTKESVWDHFVANASKLPEGLTPSRVRKTRSRVIASGNFERSLIEYGLLRRSIYRLRDTSPMEYAQLRNGFWTIVDEELQKLEDRSSW